MQSLLASAAYAQGLPGPADAGRIRPQIMLPQAGHSIARTSIPEMQPGIEIPAEALSIKFTLHKLQLEGLTAFSNADLFDIYKPYLGKEITLATIWEIAGRITERYRNQEYFLSRAYVPAQEIENGVVKLRIIEGFVGDIVMQDPISQKYIVKDLIHTIKTQKPLKASALESFLLQLNDLPGHSFHAVVEPQENAPEGSVRLRLTPSILPGKGSLTFDNFGSRFLGPYQSTLTYQDSFIPLQQTAISLSSSILPDEMKYAALNHQVPLMPGLKLGINASYVKAQPGASLAPNDIDSQSAELGVGVYYQPVRQWLDNMIVSLRIEGKNTNGDVLNNNPLTRDRIRALRAGVSYDSEDAWNGHHYLTANLSRGLKAFGASNPGSPYLSRADAQPDFTKLDFSLLRQQSLSDLFVLINQISGQWASEPLFSAEEFGYGGSAFGRAYDPSEITGDHGLAGSAELRYRGLNTWHNFSLLPYVFYDIGKVWNKDAGGNTNIASSVGTGIYINHDTGFNTNFGIAWPLIRDPGTPLYGNGRNPRYLLQVGLLF